MITTAQATTTPRFDTSDSHDYSNFTIYDGPTARTTWWGSILAGAVVAMALMAVFAILGTAIGLTVLSTTNDTPGEGLGFGAALYWLITGLISLFVGGWTASHLRRTSDSGAGAMDGFLVWCTVTVLSGVLLTLGGGAVIGGSLAAVGDVMQSSTQSTNQNGARSTNSDSTLRGSGQVTEEQAKDAAGRAAGASWWTFIALVLGASVAAAGGGAATRRDEGGLTHGKRDRKADAHRN